MSKAEYIIADLKTERAALAQALLVVRDIAISTNFDDGSARERICEFFNTVASVDELENWVRDRQ